MAEVDDWGAGGEGQYNEDHHQDGIEGGEEEEDDLFGEDGDGGEEPADALLMRFCPHDSSMLYPQEHRRTRTLRHACRLCRYSEEASGSLIYRNVIKKEVGNVLSTVPSAVADDPTLPRTGGRNCGNCGGNEAVFFQSDTGHSDTLALILVCCNCGHKWVEGGSSDK
eukprot:CAMPEP_0183304138 /NCGR_PEP_ID=MMETSP0160_2-20130417/9333_1 /TAXON_ID=2839 ORGANISM="Odontella Sinensis, Strain Grunow 1884" /NCGR_SAMPLE_ID=MMETSP0160_2 /ASSEMBLY_ACC=CAM_ASM_000250 /LENGTH=166 /DNA_ID=CAMNT_0025467139 /DNA_START=44 /DNA_END=544 /DNA_ORIENTATION=-